MQLIEELNNGKNRIKSIDYKIIELKNQLYGISGIQYDQARTNNSASIDARQLKLIQDIDDLIQRKQELIMNLDSTKNQIDSMINSFTNEKYKQIYYSKYIIGLDNYQISKLMDCSIGTVNRLKKKADVEFKMIEYKKSHN